MSFLLFLTIFFGATTLAAAIIGIYAYRESGKTSTLLQSIERKASLARQEKEKLQRRKDLLSKEIGNQEHVEVLIELMEKITKIDRKLQEMALERE